MLIAFQEPEVAQVFRKVIEQLSDGDIHHPLRECFTVESLEKYSIELDSSSKQI